MKKDLFDLAESRRERDKGMKAALVDNDRFKEEVYDFILYLPKDWTGTGEDIRRMYEEASLPLPRHTNAWGGTISGALRRGHLVKTGQYVAMKRVTSHGRESPVLRRTSMM